MGISLILFGSLDYMIILSANNFAPSFLVFLSLMSCLCPMFRHDMGIVGITSSIHV